MNLHDKIVNGFKWTGMERFLNQFIQFVLSIVIARLISPEEYGILGILLVFINISQVFIDSGLGSSLIYYNSLDEKKLDTTFVFNFALSIILFLMLFGAAPFIESFYNIDNLSTFIRVSSIVLLTNSIIVVPTAVLKIKLDFKSLSLSNIISIFFSAICGIILAYLGFGVWSLIVQMLSKSFLQAILITIQSKWVPSLLFDINSFKRLYKYGINIFGTSVLTKFTDEGISAMIAKYISPTNLGLFIRSNQFASFPGSCVGSIISNVMFPSLSSIKDNRTDFRKLYLNATEFQAVITIPLFFFLALAAKPIVIILLTEKWIGVVPLFQILCIGRVLSIVANSTEQALIANGNSDTFFKQQVVKLLLKIVLVLIALPYGIIAIAVADAVQTLCQYLITNYFAKAKLRYTMKNQFLIVLPYLISGFIAFFMGAVSFYFIDNIIVLLFVLFVVYSSVYLILNIVVFKKHYISNFFSVLLKNFVCK